MEKKMSLEFFFSCSKTRFFFLQRLHHLSLGPLNSKQLPHHLPTNQSKHLVLVVVVVVPVVQPLRRSSHALGDLVALLQAS